MIMLKIKFICWEILNQKLVNKISWNDDKFWSKKTKYHKRGIGVLFIVDAAEKNVYIEKRHYFAFVYTIYLIIVHIFWLTVSQQQVLAISEVDFAEKRERFYWKLDKLCICLFFY